MYKLLNVPELTYMYCLRGLMLFLALYFILYDCTGTNYPVVLKRLDARFDWLPSPASIFGNKTVQMVVAEDGCNIYSAVNHSVAVVSSEGCSYFKKVCILVYKFCNTAISHIPKFLDKNFSPMLEGQLLGFVCKESIPVVCNFNPFVPKEQVFLFLPISYCG